MSAMLTGGLFAAGQEVDTREVVGGLSFVDEIQVTVVNIDVFVRDRDARTILFGALTVVRATLRRFAVGRGNDAAHTVAEAALAEHLASPRGAAISI